VLGVGIDWAEEFHDVAVGTAEQGVVEQFRIEHGPAGVAGLVQRCRARESDPGQVRVVLETRHGLLVEALLDAGFEAMYPRATLSLTRFTMGKMTTAVAMPEIANRISSRAPTATRVSCPLPTT
jgi:hypothetical protein